MPTRIVAPSSATRRRSAPCLSSSGPRGLVSKRSHEQATGPSRCGFRGYPAQVSVTWWMCPPPDVFSTVPPSRSVARSSAVIVTE